MARSTVLGNGQQCKLRKAHTEKNSDLTAGEFDHEEKGIHKAVRGCLDRTMGRSRSSSPRRAGQGCNLPALAQLQFTQCGLVSIYLYPAATSSKYSSCFSRLTFIPKNPLPNKQKCISFVLMYEDLLTMYFSHVGLKVLYLAESHLKTVRWLGRTLSGSNGKLHCTVTPDHDIFQGHPREDSFPFGGVAFSCWKSDDSSQLFRFTDHQRPTHTFYHWILREE